MNNKVMIIKDSNNNFIDELQNYFNNIFIYESKDVDESFIENCSSLFDLEMLVISATQNQKFVEDLVDTIINKYPKVKIVVGVSEENFINIFSLINKVHSVFTTPIEYDALINKLVVTLSNHHNLNPLKEVRKLEGKESTKDIDQFLDNYQGMMLFLKEDLIEYDTRIKSGDLSKELIEHIYKSLVQMANIFEKEEYISRVAPIFKEFAQFLSELKIEEIPLSKLDGFEFLSMIIDDLSVYLEEMFISRVFSDVHIFEDSLSNNINYFKKSISKVSDNNTEADGELDFF
jgi:hypothetical protein